MVQILKGDNRTSDCKYTLEVAEWRVHTKESKTKSKSFFYVRAFDKSHDYLLKEKIFIPTDIREANRGRRANRHWHSRKYWKRY